MSLIRYAVVALVPATLAGLIYAVASGFGQSEVTAQRFVNLQEGASPHAGFRRAHAKGFCLAGDFEASGALAAYTDAALFQQGQTPFVGRISIAGTNPTAPDLRAPVRSLALSFGTGDADSWRTAMNTPPVMAVATPEAFYAQLAALAPDPATGQRDPARIQAFFASHPETRAFLAWQKSYVPTQSFASERYHSINAFYLVNREGRRQAVRWAAVPAAPAANTTPLDAENPQALQDEFMARLKQGPVVFDLVFSLAGTGDDENDPTVPWPDTRPAISAGKLIIRAASAESAGNCRDINFDPLILPRGMAATLDPILRARSAAYAESYRRRARENL